MHWQQLERFVALKGSSEKPSLGLEIGDDLGSSSQARALRRALLPGIEPIASSTLMIATPARVYSVP